METPFDNYAIPDYQSLCDLIDGTIPIPGGMSLTEYLDTTWD